MASAAHEPPISQSRSIDWVCRNQRLRFMFGEIRIASVRFPAIVAATHFSLLPSDVLIDPPDLGAFQPRIEAAVIPAHPVNGHLSSVSLARSHIRYVPHQYRRYCVSVAGTFSEYLKTFSSKSRKNLHRSVRRLSEECQGQLRFQEFRHPREMADFHRLACGLSKKTYQEKLFMGGLPATDVFSRELLRLASNDAARGYLLFNGDSVIAYAFCKAEGETLIYDFIGYDRSYHNFSPGTVLLYSILENLFATGHFTTLDFGEGEAEYKRFFSNVQSLCAEIYYFRRSLRNLALVFVHVLVMRFSSVAARTAERLRFKRTLKNLFRNSPWGESQHQ